ncbi:MULTISPECIES: HAMP domain-containing sensor histidine kinase [unclassified Sphingomonas]|uniref:sensor histidine kinase n=1 Tax=unclassified Sphingomonas TaxID=196159 RepID=UPI00226A2DEA
MRIVPRSLYGRLLGISAITTLIALAFAGVAIGRVLERFVVRGLDQQLDAETGMLARAVRPDGVLMPGRIVDLPAFADAEPGWGWRVDSPMRHWVRGDAADVPPAQAPDGPGPRRHGGPHPGEARALGGERVHLRSVTVATGAGPVTIAANAPARIALAPLYEALVPLLTSLAVLGLGLAAATALQLRLGLRPLRRLAGSLGAVRAGRARHIPADQPAEIAPLAAELNALIDQNSERLDHARRHVANLAHGLKTPLAALGLALAEEGRDPDGTLGRMVARIDAQVRHHLGRARAAAPGGGQRVRTPLGPAVADLAAVLARIHADRAVTATIAVADDLTVAVDRQDLDEMLGNLLDNAWRHARGAVRIAAVRAGAVMVLAIEDDGAGLDQGARVEALVPGRRLDERGDGHGFGLPIAVELAELNGGTLTLEPAAGLGGLRVVLTLPA